MPNFKGFNTIDQDKKFSLVDRELIKRDLLNAFSIREGEMPGRPKVGTSIWGYIFEPLDGTSRNGLEIEVRRVVRSDPRIQLENVSITYNENTIVIELDVLLLPELDAETFFIEFDKNSENANIS